MGKKIIRLDFSNFKYLGEVHEKIRTEFNFPEWYGANLSAFDDLLETECDADEIIISGVGTLNDELKDYISRIVEILDKQKKSRVAHSERFSHIKPFSYRIEN